jgi:hypothetical protein
MRMHRAGLILILGGLAATLAPAQAQQVVGPGEGVAAPVVTDFSAVAPPTELGSTIAPGVVVGETIVPGSGTYVGGLPGVASGTIVTDFNPPAVTYSSSYVPPASMAVAGTGGVYALSETGPTPPYSYYAAFPEPARYYVGYGGNDFPFYGQAYGHAYDRFSWSTLSGANRLDRYYYPPVR